MTLGASPARAWRHVVVPYLWRPLASGAALAAAISLGEFGATSFLSRSGGETMPIVIDQLLGRTGSILQAQGYVLATLLAGATIALVAIVELDDVAQRRDDLSARRSRPIASRRDVSRGRDDGRIARGRRRHGAIRRPGRARPRVADRRHPATRRAARPVGQRQEHAAEGDRRHRAPGSRARVRDRRRRRDRRTPTHRRQVGHGVPGQPAVPAPVGGRQRRVRAADAPASIGGHATSGPTSGSNGSGSAASARATSPRCRAARPNASRSPAR